jgi:FixJ family two-component response regulator
LKSEEGLLPFCDGQVTRKSKRASATGGKEHVRKQAEKLIAAAAETVLVVDDDPSVLGALARLIRSSGYRVRTFARPSALSSADIPRRNACLLVDVYLPEMNGIDMCESLAKSGRGLPAILITGRNDAATTRLIDRANALAVLFKPIDEKPLLEAIARGIASSNEVTRHLR